MRTGTKFIRLPIILFTMLLLASCGGGGPTPEDTSTDVARKFVIHFWNEEYEEAGEYCLGSVYSYDVMRGLYEHDLPEIEEHFDDVDDYLDAIDFDSPEIRKPNVKRSDLAEIREAQGVEIVAGAEVEVIDFNERLDGSVGVIKHEGVWKVISPHCWSKKFISTLSTARKKKFGVDRF